MRTSLGDVAKLHDYPRRSTRPVVGYCGGQRKTGARRGEKSTHSPIRQQQAVSYNHYTTCN